MESQITQMFFSFSILLDSKLLKQAFMSLSKMVVLIF